MCWSARRFDSAADPPEGTQFSLEELRAAG